MDHVKKHLCMLIRRTFANSSIYKHTCYRSQKGFALKDTTHTNNHPDHKGDSNTSSSNKAELPLFPLLKRTSKSVPDPLALNLQMGLMVCAAVHVAVQLKLPDLLATPRTLGELARESETHEATLLSLLHALCHIGIFEEIDAPTHLFGNTERSQLLRSDAMADLVRLWGAPYQWNSWRDLLFTVQTGKPALQKLYGPGATIWKYFQLHPQEQQIFQQGLSANARLLLPLILDSYDFSELHHVVDVGGGQGLLCYSLLERYPKLKGTLFDRIEVIEQAHEHLPRTVANRCALLPGDFLRAADLPQWADGYIYKNVLMDWSDETYLRILSACYQAMDRTRGRVIVIEPLVSEDACFTPFFSLQMSMMMQAAHHRTLQEHRALLEAAGFHITRVRLLGLEYALLEARPQETEEQTEASLHTANREVHA